MHTNSVSTATNQYPVLLALGGNCTEIDEIDPLLGLYGALGYKPTFSSEPEGLVLSVYPV